ncbi:MAG TPA: hypothetical protein VGF55_22680 [Gemmataceae bacterium]
MMTLAFAVSPIVAPAADKQITDIKELAGTWQGWAKSQLAGDERVVMTIKPDGSYQARRQPQREHRPGGLRAIEIGGMSFTRARGHGQAR